MATIVITLSDDFGNDLPNSVTFSVSHDIDPNGADKDQPPTAAMMAAATLIDAFYAGSKNAVDTTADPAAVAGPSLLSPAVPAVAPDAVETNFWLGDASETSASGA